jgi:hypothetical protein
MLIRLLLMALVLASGFSSAASQVRAEKQQEKPSTKTTDPVAQDKPEIWISLVDGRRLPADDVTERADGIWYKRGNVSTFIERKRIDRVERPTKEKPTPSVETSQKSVSWSLSDAAKVDKFFMDKFGRHLPTTAFGQSELHTRWGLDHRQGMDVGLHPDSPEGRALIAFLIREGIPFLAFRNAIPGVATGPHIHVGNASHRFLGTKP